MDLGTTRVVLRLIDLATGRALGEHAFDNPQIAIGPDVLARIHHADIARRPRGAEPASSSAASTRAIGDVCRTAGIEPRDICAVCRSPATPP
ncbi:MAG: hypothetical protein MZV70_20790 [Desulfobacterales bacterium]|nr:hypothetical protein [Desulfobacterales bacterium]